MSYVTLEFGRRLYAGRAKGGLDHSNARWRMMGEGERPICCPIDGQESTCVCGHSRGALTKPWTPFSSGVLSDSHWFTNLPPGIGGLISDSLAYPSFTFMMYIQLYGHWVHKEDYYAAPFASSSWDLESTNSSTSLIFKLPSASVTMCEIQIDS